MARSQKVNKDFFGKEFFSKVLLQRPKAGTSLAGRRRQSHTELGPEVRSKRPRSPGNFQSSVFFCSGLCESIP